MNSQVEQVDREAVAKLLGGAAPEGLLSGSKDTLSVVQAFAAHRLASLASQPPVLDEREVIERCAKVADGMFMDAEESLELGVHVPHNIGGSKVAERIAKAIRNLGGPDDVA